MTTITLNPMLKEIKESTGWAPVVSDSFINKIMCKLPKLEKGKYALISPMDSNCEAVQLGFLGMLSQAYSQHLKVEIAPHDIWYMIMTEIADIIKNNSEVCRHLFTSSDKKVDISVPTNDVTKIDLSLVVQQLHELVPVDVNLFAPQFSTLDQHSQLACYAALCDGLQVYYSYSTFLCGIPAIRVVGSREDWDLMVTNLKEIKALFETTGLNEFVNYLVEVNNLIQGMIDNSFDKPRAEFWKDIFTQKNVGSGGGLQISGWITKLFFRKCELPKLENFPSTISVVPYVNVETKRNFIGVNGAFQRIRTEDGFVKTSYRQMVFEVV
jgi:hypothetical protein